MAAAVRAAHGANIAKEKRKALEKKKEEELADHYLDQFDQGQDGKINRDEMRALLTKVEQFISKNEAAVVDDEILEEIMKSMDKDHDGEVEKKHVLPAIRKYKALIKHREHIQAIFSKHDKDHSSSLDRTEILRMCEDILTMPSMGMQVRAAPGGTRHAQRHAAPPALSPHPPAPIGCTHARVARLAPCRSSTWRPPTSTLTSSWTTATRTETAPSRERRSGWRSPNGRTLPDRPSTRARGRSLRRVSCCEERCKTPHGGTD